MGAPPFVFVAVMVRVGVMKPVPWAIALFKEDRRDQPTGRNNLFVNGAFDGAS